MNTTKKLISNSLIIVGGTALASIFSMIFSSIVMPRILSAEHLGEFSSLMNLLMIVSVAGGAILTIVMRYSSELYAEEKREAIGRMLSVVNKYVYLMAVVLFLIGLLLLKPIADYLSIDSTGPVAITFISVIFGLSIMINKGVLQGTQRFVALSLINILEMALRLCLGILLVKLGWGVSGALLAVVVATALSYLVSFPALQRSLSSIKKDKTPADYSFNKKEIINYSRPAFLTSLLLVFALAIDVILVKHYFSAEEAGIYAAISNIGKIIAYATTPIISVMFPMISEKQTRGDKHYSIFMFSLLFVIAVSLAIIGAYTIAPAKIISLISGQKFSSFYYLLPEVGLAMVFYSLINLMSNYYLVVKKFSFLWVFFLLEILQICAISIWHDSIVIVVRLIVLTFALLFAWMMGYYLFDKRVQIAQYFRGE